MSQSTNQPANNSRGLSIASMVCGIISVAACIGAFTLAGIFILILALVAVILAVQARKLAGGRMVCQLQAWCLASSASV